MSSESWTLLLAMWEEHLAGCFWGPMKGLGRLSTHSWPCVLAGPLKPGYIMTVWNDWPPEHLPITWPLQLQSLLPRHRITHRDVHTSTYINMHTYMHTCSHTHIHTCTQIHTSISIHVLAHMQLQLTYMLHTYTHMRTNTHTCTHAQIWSSPCCVQSSPQWILKAHRLSSLFLDLVSQSVLNRLNFSVMF